MLYPVELWVLHWPLNLPSRASAASEYFGARTARPRGLPFYTRPLPAVARGFQDAVEAVGTGQGVGNRRFVGTDLLGEVGEHAPGAARERYARFDRVGEQRLHRERKAKLVAGARGTVDAKGHGVFDLEDRRVKG